MKIKKQIKSHKNKTQNGGKVLGSGTYGCVVYPSIPCSNINKRTKIKLHKNKNISNSLNANLTVSKLINKPDSQAIDELQMSRQLLKKDPHSQYFITIKDSCYIKKIPNTRTNTASGKFMHKNKFISDKLTTTNKTNKLDKKHCKLDFRYKPLNLIMEYGGYSLFNINQSALKNPKIFKIITLMYNNFKECFKNLLLGIKKMQEQRIIHCDIKLDNVMVNLNESTNTINMRFIDFGLSKHLTKEFCSYENNRKNFDNFYLLGTPGYVSPDIIIINHLYNTDLTNYSYNKIITELKKDTVNSYLFLLENQLIKILENIVKPLSIKINKDINNVKEFIKSYFGTENNRFDGYLQKNDIFALGITIYEFIHYFYEDFKNNELIKTININNIDDRVNNYNYNLRDLLIKMIHPNPYQRLNVNQCLKHKYFID